MSQLLRFLPGISLIILLIFHTVGIVLLAKSPENADLTWVTLSLCAFLIFINEASFLRGFVLLVLIYTAGFWLEWLGVSTGYLFGSYSYGDSLGFKYLDIPLIIGLNWYVLVVSASNLLRTANAPSWIIAIAAGLSCTLLDVLIEPVATQLDFWQWENNSIPLFNYVCWWGVSTLFCYLYLLISPQRINPVGRGLFLIWTIFFLILNFV